MHQAEKEAAESLSILDTLQSSAPVGFSYVDRDFRFVRVNEKAAAINGVWYRPPRPDDGGGHPAVLAPAGALLPGRL